SFPLSLHDALPISGTGRPEGSNRTTFIGRRWAGGGCRAVFCGRGPAEMAGRRWWLAILAAREDFMPVEMGVLSGQDRCQPCRAGLAAAARQLGTAAVGGLMRGSATAMDGGNAGFAGAKAGPRIPIARNLSSRSCFVAYHPWRQPFGPSLCDVTNCSCNLLRCIARIPHSPSLPTATDRKARPVPRSSPGIIRADLSMTIHFGVL